MREAIGGAWLLGIVMTFMVIFIAYVAISFNYSNAYKLKTEMVTVVEQYSGINSTSLEKMDRLIKNHSYRIRFNCELEEDEKVLGITEQHVTTNPTKPQEYCVTRTASDAKTSDEKKYHYTVTVAFNFSLPVLGDLFTFKVKGETNAIYYPNDPYF